MTATGLRDLSPTTSAAVGRAQGDSAALATLRFDGARLAETLPLPDSYQQRPWKYLDVSGMRFDGLAPSPAGAPSLDGDPGAGAGLIVQDEGAVAAQATAVGLTVAPFVGASGAAAAIIAAHAGSLVPAARSKFTALHYAFLSGGALISVAANAEIAGSVRIERRFHAANQLATPHTLIVTGANSRVSVIEDFRSSDEPMIVLPVVEIVPGPGAQVRYTALHRWGAQTRVFGEQRTRTERESAVTSLAVATGGRVVKQHIEASLVGRGSSSELFGLFAGADRQHIDFYTVQDHIGADTRSDLLFKAALTDAARSVYYGLTRVGLGAKNADANQVDRNLLLSRDARADSDPVLEILTNDIIRAAHGATAGPVDEEQRYYLESRGIPPEAAEGLLVRGFLGQVLDRIPDEALRDEVEQALLTKLGA